MWYRAGLTNTSTAALCHLTNHVGTALKRSWLAPAVLVLAVLLSACGNGSAEGEPEAISTPTGETITTSTIGPPEGVDYALVGSETAADPDRSVGFAIFGDEVTSDAPTLTAQVGEPVTLWLVNSHGQYSSSADSHDLAIIPKLDDIPTLAATGALKEHVLWDATIDKLFSGQTGSVTFTPDVPGEYLFVCTIPGHAAAGMMGDFVVSE